MRVAVGVVVTLASVPPGSGADTGSGRTGTSRPRAEAPGRGAAQNEEEIVNSWDLNAVDVKPGHPDIVEALDLIPHNLSRDDRLLCHGQIGCAGRNDEDGSSTRRQRGGAQCNGSREFVKRCTRHTALDGIERFTGCSRDQEVVSRGDDSFRNCRDLLGSFARTVHHLGETLADASMVIHARKLEILVRRVAQIL